MSFGIEVRQHQRTTEVLFATVGDSSYGQSSTGVTLFVSGNITELLKNTWKTMQSVKANMGS